MKRELIEVEWDDISGGSSWDDVERDYTDDLVHCKTLGYKLKSNKKTLVIASTITEKERCCDRTVIPRSVITSIRRIV